jgi:hypothetical protein
VLASGARVGVVRDAEEMLGPLGAWGIPRARRVVLRGVSPREEPQVGRRNVADGASPNSCRYAPAKRPSSAKPWSLAISVTVLAVTSA